MTPQSMTDAKVIRVQYDALGRLGWVPKPAKTFTTNRSGSAAEKMQQWMNNGCFRVVSAVKVS